MSVQRSPSPEMARLASVRVRTRFSRGPGDPAHITIAVSAERHHPPRTESDAGQANRIRNLSEIRIRPADSR